MKCDKHHENDLIKLCYLYLEYRNTFNLHFQKYGYFKQMIRWITNISNPDNIRWIFQKLLQRDYFIKRKVGTSTAYHFNPNNKRFPNKPLIISFD